MCIYAHNDGDLILDCSISTLIISPKQTAGSRNSNRIWYYHIKTMHSSPRISFLRFFEVAILEVVHVIASFCLSEHLMAEKECVAQIRKNYRTQTKLQCACY